jgi:PAS domain S-box-containing protein
MVADSPVPYLRIEIVTCEKPEDPYLRVKSYNEAYERTFIKNSKNWGKSFDQRSRHPEEVEAWRAAFVKAKQEKKATFETYTDILKTNVRVSVYHAGENEFFVRVIKVNGQYQQLSKALKTSPCLAWIKDIDGRYIDVNDRYLQVLQKSRHEVIGKLDDELLDSNVALSAKCTDEQVLRGNQLVKYEFLSDNPHGDNVYVDVVKWPYMDSDNHIILGTIGIGMDITHAVQSRRKLEETESRFLEIANNSRDVIMVIKGEDRLEYVNPAFEKIYGFKPDSLYDSLENWWKHWDNVVFEPELSAINNKEPHSIKYKVSKSGEADRWIWSRFVPILNQQGDTEKLIGVLSDITKDKEFEEELQHFKNELLADLSHDLRTPITVILSALQVLSMQLGQLDEKTRTTWEKYLTLISKNGNRLLKFVNNLIDLHKLEKGQLRYIPQRADIVSFVEDICHSVLPYTESKHLDLIFDTDEEVKYLSFDPTHMERIILNLLSNAIKFSKPGGTIEVTIACSDVVQIHVKDRGMGIPDEQLESIFFRFRQAHNDGKKEGSGIGLSIVNSLVELHGGKITVQSKLGEGSEFIITLPTLSEAEPMVAEIPPQLHPMAHPMIPVEFSDLER